MATEHPLLLHHLPARAVQILPPVALLDHGFQVLQPHHPVRRHIALDQRARPLAPEIEIVRRGQVDGIEAARRETGNRLSSVSLRLLSASNNKYSVIILVSDAG